MDKWISALLVMIFVEGRGFSRAAQCREKMGL